MPAVPTIAGGSRLTADRLNFLMRRPMAILRQGTAQTIPSGGTFTAVTLDVEAEDTDPDGIGGHSTSSNTSRYTARYPGVYQLSGGVAYATATAGARGAGWLLNGSMIDGSDVMVMTTTTTSTSARVPARTILVRLTEGDYVELGAFQNSGSNLATAVGGAASSAMYVTWIRI